MDKLSAKFSFFVFSLTCAWMVEAGEIETNGCRAVWTDKTLEIGNQHFLRRYVASNGVLRTTLFKARDGAAWLGRATASDAADPIAVRAEAAKWSPVGVEGLRLFVTIRGATTRLDLYPAMPGVIVMRPGVTECPALHDETRPWIRMANGIRNPIFDQLPKVAAMCDTISIHHRHVKATEFTCLDQTDIRDRLLRTDERQLMRYDWIYTLSSSGLDLQDSISRDGLVFTRLAPMPMSRPKPVEDFIVSGAAEGVSLLANGYPLVELAYTGGAAGRRRAMVAFQRSIRPYRPGRDGLLLSNTWGAGNRDSRICQDFLLKEIEAGAKIGVDVIQIDDGWQHGRTSNSQKQANAGKKKVWNGYWEVDPDFWTEDRERFPDGLDLLVRKAREKGMRFGLWFGPDSSNDAANWERDANCLLDYHRRLGIDYFKMDSMKLRSELAFSRNRMMFNKMLAESNGDMVFDLDCTAEIRPGFLGILDIGPHFVENRYTRRPVYWPHCTLKNLWDLAQVIDPVRLRFEFNNPDTNHENYKWSPLGHGNWYFHPDTLFAIVMAASPLAWMELSDVSERSVAALAPLVRTWKAERARWHGGVIHPVGNHPDGVNWTGFVSEAADGNGGYALLFRGVTEKGSYTLDLEPIFGAVRLTEAKVIGGRGTVRTDGGTMTVSVNGYMDFIWVKFATVSEVPALLTTAKGERVDSVQAWEQVRRPEVLKTLREEVYGVRPVERPDNLAFRVLKEAPAFGGKAVKKLVRSTYSGPGGEGELVFAAWLPKRRAKAPAFLHVSPRPADTAADTNAPRPIYLLPAEQIVDRGYAAIAVCDYDSALDWQKTPAVRTNGVFRAFGPRNLDERRDTEWGILSAWAWGASRVMDWIETEPAIDAKRVAVVGLSRNGKTALVTGAQDERFAMVVSCCSGMGGAKLNHLPCNAAEDVEAIMIAQRWFSPRFRQWVGRDREMPFDQHWLLALVAPRLLYVSSATEDCWAGSRGEFASCRLASPAWELYGKPGFVESGFPAPDEALTAGSIGYHLRTGEHAIKPDDWRHYLDFADAHGWNVAK